MEFHQVTSYKKPTIELIFSIVSNKKFNIDNFFENTEFYKTTKLNGRLSEFSLDLRTKEVSNSENFSGLIEKFINTILTEKKLIRKLIQIEKAKYYLSFEIVIRNGGQMPAILLLKRDKLEKLLDLEIDMKIYAYNFSVQEKKFWVAYREFSENYSKKNQIVKEIEQDDDDYKLTISAENAIENLLKIVKTSSCLMIELVISLNCVSSIGIYDMIKFVDGANFNKLNIVIE